MWIYPTRGGWIFNRRQLKWVKYRIWLVFEPYPSEKWWSSSVGMMKFPTGWKKSSKCSKPPTRNTLAVGTGGTFEKKMCPTTEKNGEFDGLSCEVFAGLLSQHCATPILNTPIYGPNDVEIPNRKTYGFATNGGVSWLFASPDSKIQVCLFWYSIHHFWK